MHRWSRGFALVAALVAGPAGAQEDLQSRFFESDGVRIHYIDEGTGEPVLLIHGFSIDLGFNWVSPGIVSALTEAGYRVIAYDSRGHGKSDKPHDPAEYGPVEVEDAVRLLDHLDISRAHVVGYSRGGMLANQVAIQHPQRVITAILGGYGAGPSEAMVLSVSMVIDSLKQGSIGPIIRGLQGEDHPGVPPEEIAALNRLVTSMNDMEALVAALRAEASLPPMTEDAMKEVRSPMLALVGEYDAMRRGVDWMTGIVAGLEVLVIPTADHVTALNRPEFVTGLLGFLAKQDGGMPVGSEEP